MLSLWGISNSILRYAFDLESGLAFRCSNWIFFFLRTVTSKTVYKTLSVESATFFFVI